ncbi:MerR family transcriptional regulator [Nocardia asiatica]|uniref:MerR family transcriptional regulator n=1 Tax=Nocardia asiatica TaxID=209252 RepID=UPI0005C1E3F3|nr:MerR family transcriptional regulator [Nocardia asiatica]
MSREPPATEYTVGAVAARLGVPVATLRSWNQRYAIGPPRERTGAHRRYSEADIATLRRMIGLVRAGATPASAARQALDEAETDPAAADRGALLTAAEGLEPDIALTLLTARLARDGVVSTWNTLCRPVFAAIVAGQERGRGLIEVEHLLSWVTIAALHRVFPPARRPRSQAPILLACTAGENHVLPIEVLRAALAERGIVALLLGAAVPDSALTDALSHQRRPSVLLLWAQTRATAGPETVSAVRPAARVLVAGPGWASVPLPSEVVYVRALEDALDALSGHGVRHDIW